MAKTGFPNSTMAIDIAKVPFCIPDSIAIEVHCALFKAKDLADK